VCEYRHVHIVENVLVKVAGSSSFHNNDNVWTFLKFWNQTDLWLCLVPWSCKWCIGFESREPWIHVSSGPITVVLGKSLLILKRHWHPPRIEHSDIAGVFGCVYVWVCGCVGMCVISDVHRCWHISVCLITDNSYVVMSTGLMRISESINQITNRWTRLSSFFLFGIILQKMK
jgi:hypothetical protein